MDSFNYIHGKYKKNGTGGDRSINPSSHSSSGKNIILCFDGTRENFGPQPFTNILKLYNLLRTVIVLNKFVITNLELVQLDLTLLLMSEDG